jgi:hypothetical protein
MIEPLPLSPAGVPTEKWLPGSATGTPPFLPWALGAIPTPQATMPPPAIDEAAAALHTPAIAGPPPAPAPQVEPTIPATRAAQAPMALPGAADAPPAVRMPEVVPAIVPAIAPAAAPEVARVEMELVDASGSRTLVTLHWQLAATGHLAQRSAADVAHAALALSHAVGSHGAAPVAPSPVAASARVPAALAAAARADGAPRAMPVATPMRTTAAIGGDEAGVPAHAQGAPASTEWALRLFRWLERDGRDAAIFLRDYRLDDTEASRLSDVLRGFAREHGLTIERIVINGREHWRGANAHATTHGST